MAFPDRSTDTIAHVPPRPFDDGLSGSAPDAFPAPQQAPADPRAGGAGADVHPELSGLLRPESEAAREDAWAAFIGRHSRLLLHVARTVTPDRDEAMDAYAHLLERLRRDDFQVLRTFTADGRSLFTTWLTVVARRACIDRYRQVHGRPRGLPSDRAQLERAARHRLARFAGTPAELDVLEEDAAAGPEARVRARQLRDALDAAIAALAPEDRLLLQLRFEADLSAQAIAPLLGMPTPFHVYRRLRAVCRLLRTRLGERGIEESAP